MPLINYLTQIQFEAGAIKLVQGEADKLGIARPLIVTDKGVRGAGLLERLTAQLKDGAQLPVAPHHDRGVVAERLGEHHLDASGQRRRSPLG